MFEAIEAIRDLIHFICTPTRVRMRSPEPLPNPRVRRFNHLDPLLPSGRRGVETHAHQCDDCGHIWRHPDDTVRTSPEEFDRAHTCPACRIGFSTWRL